MKHIYILLILLILLISSCAQVAVKSNLTQASPDKLVLIVGKIIFFDEKTNKDFPLSLMEIDLKDLNQTVMPDDFKRRLLGYLERYENIKKKVYII